MDDANRAEKEALLARAYAALSDLGPYSWDFPKEEQDRFWTVTFDLKRHYFELSAIPIRRAAK